MEISFDSRKRQWTLEKRGLDFADATLILNDIYVVQVDDRKPYPEERFLTYGFLQRRLVMFA